MGVGLGVFLVEQGLEDDHAEYDPDQAERVSDGAGGGHLVGGERTCRVNLEQGLLRGSEHRGVGGGSCEQARGDRHGDACQAADQHGERSPGEEHCEGQDVEFDAAFFEGREEARAYLEAKRIDEQHQTEVLCEGEHLRVHGQAEMSCEDAGEEDECHAEADSLELQLVAQQPYDAYQRQDEYRLGVGLLSEYVDQPVHITSAK